MQDPDALHGERGSTLARVAALGALVAAVALIALAMFGGGDGYKVKAVFQNAGQLVPGNPVQVGGGKIGTVNDIELDDNAQAVVTLKVDDDFAPPPPGHRRRPSGPPPCRGSPTATCRSSRARTTREEIDDGGTSAPTRPTRRWTSTRSSTRSTTRTREGLQERHPGLRRLVRRQGRARRDEATKYFSPFLVSTSDLTRELALDQEVLERFVMTPPRRSPRSPSAATTSRTSCPTRTPRSARSPTRTRARSRARAAARHAAQGEHHVREPALHAG